jgi:hypothetical protein
MTRPGELGFDLPRRNIEDHPSEAAARVCASASDRCDGHIYRAAGRSVLQFGHKLFAAKIEAERIRTDCPVLKPLLKSAILASSEFSIILQRGKAQQKAK